MEVRNQAVRNRYKMSASIHPINTATVASTVSNLVTWVTMVSRHPMVRVITMITEATVIALLTKVAINAHE
jgi:hypothetical protein